MQIIGKIAGLLLGLIALYLSATNFLAVAPTADETETSAAPYELIFTHTESMALALTDEMVPTITAYGIDGPAPAAFSEDIAAARQESTAALEALQALAAQNALPPALEIQFAELQSQVDGLGVTRAEIDRDLNLEPGVEKMLSSRRVMRAIGTISRTLLNIERLILFTAPATDTASTAALHLRHNLLVVLNYSAYEAATLGNYVASGQPISAITKDIGSRYGGRIGAAWETARSIGIGGLFDQSVTKNLDTIQTVFFDEFTDSRFELYDISDDALDGAPENGDDVTVDYYQDPESWIEIYSTAATPVLELLATARNMFAKTQIPISTEEAPLTTETLDKILFVAAAVLLLLFLLAQKMETTATDPTQVDASYTTNDSTMALIQLAEEVRALSGRIDKIER